MKSARLCEGFITVLLLSFTPDFGRFLRSRGPKAGRAPEKPPSPLTRKTGSHTDGLDGF